VTHVDPFTADIVSRCRWAEHNGGHPNPAWSTGERLAVALILDATEHLAAMDYTHNEAVQRVRGGMLNPPADFGTWVRQIRQMLERPTYQANEAGDDER
jgi:hypothetical protein